MTFSSIRAALLVFVAIAASEFKPYPGAHSTPWLDRYEAQANKVLQQIGADQPAVEMWITDDAYDTVRAFYAKLGKEDAAFGAQVVKPQSDSTKRHVQATFVMFDGATTPIASKYYVMIQRPVVLSYHPVDVRDVTLIGLYKKTQ
jgi:hypothetical protein